MISKEIIRIAVVDDHQIVIDGLKLLLNDQTDLQVIIENKNALHMLKALAETKVDLVLTDVIMPNQMSGVDFSRLLKEKKDAPKILVLSMTEDPKIIYQLIEEIKVDGYMSKEAGKEEVIEAIHKVYNGGKYYSRNIKKIYDQYLETFSENQKLHLTNREMELLKCIVKHYSNKQIAIELEISERTVETHRKNIYRKTDTRGEAALIEFIKAKNIL
jgi:two-component system, NarL family, nitrate/nitrite response regulator NarL